MTGAGETYLRRDGILAQEAHGQTVILRLRDGSYYTIEGEVGAVVWEHCDGSSTAEEIVAAVCSEFDAPENVVRADVAELLQELLGEGLIDRDP